MAKSSRTIGKDARARIRRSVPSMSEGFVKGKGRGIGTSLDRMETEYRAFVAENFPEAYSAITDAPLSRTATKYATDAMRDVQDYLNRLARSAVRIWDSPQFQALTQEELGSLASLVKRAYRDNLGHDDFLSLARGINDSAFFERVADTAAGYVKIRGRMYRIDKLTEITTQINIAQTQREAVIRKAKQGGNDLVEIIGPRDSKDFCSRLVGRVFSISGKSEEFPPLRNLPNGGPPFHPHCRHRATPADSVAPLLPFASDTPDYLLTDDSYEAEKEFQRRD